MNNKQPGAIVQTKNGFFGRTYNKRKALNGKVAVYLFDLSNIPKGSQIELIQLFDQPTQETPLLCNPESLSILGFID